MLRLESVPKPELNHLSASIRIASIGNGLSAAQSAVHCSITGSYNTLMSAPETIVTEPSIAVPIATAGAAVGRRSALGVRAWVLTAVLFLVPLVAYWPATFHDYGLRDDYSNLREAHEEVGKVFRFCASHARPIYGWLLQATYGQTTSVQNLQWMRFAASLLLGAISLVSFRGLRALGWSHRHQPVFCGAAEPGAIRASHGGMGGRLAVRRDRAAGVRRHFSPSKAHWPLGLSAGLGRAVAQWSVALGLMVVSALIYQPSALFYVVPLAGALIAQRHRSLHADGALGWDVISDSWWAPWAWPIA